MREVSRRSAKALALTCMIGVLAGATLAIAHTGGIKSSTGHINGNETKSAHVTCRRGTRPQYAAFKMTASPDVALWPLRATVKGRTLTVTATDGRSANQKFTATTRCGKGPKVKARPTTAFSQGSSTNVIAKASCRRGERLAYGGFRIKDPDRFGTFLSALQKTGQRSWLVRAFTHDDASSVTAVAYCSKHAPKTTSVSDTADVSTGGSRTLAPVCPHGGQARFGGFGSSVTEFEQFVTPRTSARLNSGQWKTSATNGTNDFTGTLTAWSYCS